MNYDNAVRKPSQPADPNDPRRNIHLVYSKPARPSAVGTVNFAEMPRAARLRGDDGMDRLLLTFAAVSAPMIWVGHALFEWIRTH